MRPTPAVAHIVDACATAIAVIDADFIVRAANPALCEWLGSGSRTWRGDALAMLDAKPPHLTDAASRAVAEQRRIWLRDARLRTAIGDRGADLAFTPIDDGLVLIELHASSAEP